jgi:acyl dehydratase
MQLMTEPGFPFPLLGVVQVGNKIIQHRPVLAEEKVTVTVRTGPLSDHPSGRQIAILSEATVAGEPVWTETTSYLHREHTEAGARERPPGGDPAGGSPASGDRPSADLPDGPVRRIAVPADIGRRYAAVSGDRNPIHLSRLSARAFGFDRSIAHGMWLAARTLAAFEDRLPPACTIDLAFKTPAFLPGVVLLRSAPLEPAAANPAGEPVEGWRLLVSAARTGKPHLAGTVTAPAPPRG